LFVEDRRESDEVRARLEEHRRHVDGLEAQLMPIDVANVEIEGEKAGTIVAVQIIEALEMPTKKLGELFSLVHVLTERNPPFFVFKVVLDTVYSVGGLFLKRKELLVHAEPGIALARSVAEELQRLGVKFSIAVALGGHFSVDVSKDGTPSLEVRGPVIDEVADLAAAGPADAIIISQAFRDAVNDLPGICFRLGPVVKGQSSYLI
jgi:hypothetical protein